jgi:hypothetical protein
MTNILRFNRNLYLAAATVFLAALTGLILFNSWLPKLASAAALIGTGYFLFISLGGLIGYLPVLSLDYVAPLALVIGAFIGAPIGATLTNRYRDKEISTRLAWLYLAVITSIVLDLGAVTWPLLSYASLSVLFVFLIGIIIDFFKRFSNPNHFPY